jgi:decaprenylphospho-beta-D-erythro-pentofuranosid-2-ulose 2-reductase
MVSANPRSRVRPAPGTAAEGPGGYHRILLVGGTSEIGLAILGSLGLSPDTEVLLAGRDAERMTAASGSLPARIKALGYDATDPQAAQALVEAAFADGPVDLVISAAGVLTPQEQMDAAPERAATLIQTNFTSHVTTLLGVAGRMRSVGRGTIVVLSSVAAVRPRRANFVYGAAKAGLDAFARGLADSLDSSGVRVLLVRPGFVIGRMTAGMKPAPLATTPAQVGAAVAAGLAGSASVVWVPASLRPFAAAMRLIPRPVWRRMRS